MSYSTDHAELGNAISGHPCWLDGARPGSPGYTLPFERALTCYSTDVESDVAALAAIGIIAPPGGGHQIHVSDEHGSFDVRLEMMGHGNTVVLGYFRHLAGRFALVDDRNVMVLSGARHEVAGIWADLIGPSTGVFVGMDGVAYGCRATAEAGGSVCIGDGCLISDQIEIRGTDSHAIVDCRTRKVLNQPEAVVVEPRVWIGQKVSIFKGTRVGTGSVIAAHAVLTGDAVPQHCIVGGVPAKVIRRGATWHRHYPSGLLAPLADEALSPPAGFVSLLPDSRD